MSVFLSSLKENSFLDNIHMKVCNVGSRKITDADDYVSQGWHIFAPNLSIYGFDADEDACNEANNDIKARQVDWVEKHIPLALGKAIEGRTLYVTKHPMCSSLYPPNEAYISRMAILPELASLDFCFDIETTTLDNFCKEERIDEVDFLQIDVQGADLDVLQGATKMLSSGVLAVQIEVEFSHLYTDQPLFADVDTFLRANGFTLFDIDVSGAYATRTRSPIKSAARGGQLLWGDAFYFRDLLREDLQDPLKSSERLLKLACIADVLDFPDYALEILEHMTLNGDTKTENNFADIILMSLASFTEIQKRGLDKLAVIENIKHKITDCYLLSCNNV